jgi:hypothetical protein
MVPFDSTIYLRLMLCIIYCPLFRGHRRGVNYTTLLLLLLHTCTINQTVMA